VKSALSMEPDVGIEPTTDGLQNQIKHAKRPCLLVFLQILKTRNSDENRSNVRIRQRF
jgi:hypothetical protein